MEIETNGLTLTPVAEADLAEIAQLYCDARVASHMRFGVLDRAAVAELLQDYLLTWQQQDFGMWTARRSSDGTYVGETGLRVHHRTGQPALRYATAPGFWRQGYASAMAKAALSDGFGRCGLAHIDAFVQGGNPSSQKTAERIGMHVAEETKTENGTLLRYSAVREDWLAWAGENA